jgi:hypothetical protein
MSEGAMTSAQAPPIILDRATRPQAANALYALRCYCDATRHLGVIDGILLGIRRDGAGGLVPDSCPAGLHAGSASSCCSRSRQHPAGACAADAVNAETIRAGNALLALGRYWGRTHLLGVTSGVWMAISRDSKRPVAAAGSPAGLHAQLARQCGYVPSLGAPESRTAEDAGGTVFPAAARYARQPAETSP